MWDSLMKSAEKNLMKILASACAVGDPIATSAGQAYTIDDFYKSELYIDTLGRSDDFVTKY